MKLSNLIEAKKRPIVSTLSCNNTECGKVQSFQCNKKTAMIDNGMTPKECTKCGGPATFSKTSDYNKEKTEEKYKSLLKAD